MSSNAQDAAGGVRRLDPALTLALAQASLAAYNDYEGLPYTPPPDYITLGRFTGWDGWIGDFGAEERFGLIFKYNGPATVASRFIVAFRGTDSYSDMFEDAFWESATFKPYNAMMLSGADDVCSGFNGIYSSTGEGSIPQSMQQQIFSMLPEHMSEVLITGHSLGAALSQLFTLDMRLTFPQVRIQTMNFSSPRVGGADWAEACLSAGATERITRVINYWDYVPEFPQAIFDFFDNYVSIGAEFQTSFYGEDISVFDELHRHRLLNLQTVLQNCLPLSPQIWVGTFTDAVDTDYEMWSTAPPDMTKDEMVEKLRELHRLERAARAAQSRSDPFT